ARLGNRPTRSTGVRKGSLCEECALLLVRHDRCHELTLHLASIVLGAGTPLFTGGAPRILVQRSVIATSTTKHLI
ncbi:MAG TPA: hypothetical protein VIK32_00705, partial [Candidatus Limnocylindrales bacterium]